MSTTAHADASTSATGTKPLDVEELFRLYANDVLRTCYVYMKDYDLAQDAFQEVFLKICRKKGQYRNESSVRYWVLAIARNVCKDYLKSAWSKKVVSLEAWDDQLPRQKSDTRRRPIAADEEENSIIDRIDEPTDLMKAVLDLSPKYKDVILLKFYYDLTNEQIAEQLGLKQSAVRSRLFRARKMLAAFDKEGEM